VICTPLLALLGRATLLPIMRNSEVREMVRPTRCALESNLS
jgi:hypothetical protein